MDDPKKSLLDELNRANRSLEFALPETNALTRMAEELSRASSLNRSVLEEFNRTVNLAGVGRIAELIGEREREFSALKMLTTNVGTSFDKILGSSVFDDKTRLALEAVGKSLTDRFRIPELLELQGQSARIAATLAAFEPMNTFAHIESVLSSIRGPWVDILAAQASITSFASLTTIADQIRISPFQPALTQALEGTIGRWAEIPAALIGDALGREAFYIEEGLSPQIVAVPEPTFADSLGATGIVTADLFEDEELAPFSADELNISQEELFLIVRSAKVTTLLAIFERKLRSYLGRVMTQRYGPDWPASRCAEPKTSDGWREKRKKAVRNGEEEKDIIEYADFTDYSRIILRRDNWSDLFAHHFPHQEEARVSFRRVEQIRVVASHSRDLTKGDFLTLAVEVSRILSALGLLRKALPN